MIWCFDENVHVFTLIPGANIITQDGLCHLKKD